jgi:hypothetical protein
MNTLGLAFAVGVSQGLVHGLGPDHCAAMATLGLAPGKRWAALGTALRFALGHAVALGILSSFCLGAGLVLSESFEQRAEVLGGAVLVALGTAAFFFPSALGHGHPHLPGHGADHRHRRLSLTAGALLAVSGVRALLIALAPLLVAGDFKLRGLAYLPGFALGILLSMGTLGLLLSLGLTRLGEAALRRTYRLAAAGSGALGLAWMAQHAL